MAEITATNPTTGHRIVLRNGRWEPMSPDKEGPSWTPQDREQLAAERGKLQTATRVSEAADRFLQHNYERGTGGPGSDFMIPRWWQPNRQAMEGLSAEMVRANIQPGTSSTMNSNAEQDLARSQYLSVQNAGPLNRKRAEELSRERFRQTERFNAMDQWLKERGSLTGFEQAWMAHEPQIMAKFRYVQPPTFSQQAQQQQQQRTQRATLPPVDQRQVGQVYQMANGRGGRWLGPGRGFEPVD
jgi:hypothetical protein